MESDRLTTKQMLLWTASAMSAPLAIYGGKTSWEWTLVIGILCVGISLLTIRFGSADYGKILRLVQLVTLSVAAGAFSREIPACWGEESMSMPLALLALAALSVGKSSKSAGRVCCCVAWIAAILYALVLVVGLKNIQWPRLAATGYYDGLLIVAYLLPAVWLMLPAERSGSRWPLGMVAFGLMISVLCFGTLSARGVVDAQQPIYQYSKSLTLLGIAERFEAVTSVALTLGLYCALSLLLSAAESMIKHGAVIAAVIASINVQISTKITVILAIFAWIILPTINSVKKVEKR